MQPPASAFAPPPLSDHAVPPTARTLGILAIVLGALQGVGDVFSLLSAAVSRLVVHSLGKVPTAVKGPMAVERQRDMDEYMAFAMRVEVGRAGIMFVLSGLLIAIGVGLMRGSERARRAAVVWAIVALAALVVRGLVWELVSWPRVESYMKSTLSGLPTGSGPNPLTPFRGMFEGFAHGAEYINMAVLAAFPIVLLIALHDARLKAGMR
jgi:hypothetical protein